LQRDKQFIAQVTTETLDFSEAGLAERGIIRQEIPARLELVGAN
jgi:hypothetical protein